MKNIVFILMFFSASLCASAQTIEDEFDSNLLGWTENANPERGESIIMEGVFKFVPNTKRTTFGSIPTFVNAQGLFEPNVLFADIVSPLDMTQNFTLSVDMQFQKMAYVSYINSISGVMLDFEDELNFLAIGLCDKYCYLLKSEKGKLVARKYISIKVNKEKGKVTANFKIQMRNGTLTVFVDDIEMLQQRRVSIGDPGIALFATTGVYEVLFDNFKLSPE